MDDRIEEIVRRLEALERRMDELSAPRANEGEQGPVGCPFRSEERRIVDLIVALTADRVAERLGPPPGSHQEHGGPHHGHGGPHHEHGRPHHSGPHYGHGGPHYHGGPHHGHGGPHHGHGGPHPGPHHEGPPHGPRRGEHDHCCPPPGAPRRW